MQESFWVTPLQPDTQCIEFWHMIQGQKDLTRTAEGQHRTQEVCRTLHVMSAHRVCNVYLTPFPYNKKKKTRTAYCNSRVFFASMNKFGGRFVIDSLGRTNLHLDSINVDWESGNMPTCKQRSWQDTQSNSGEGGEVNNRLLTKAFPS